MRDATNSAVGLEDQDILKAIRVLDINKAHGHDNISTRIIKICGCSIIEPFSIIFRNKLFCRSNIVPVHKKGKTQLIQNYRPVSLLPISSKIFERKKKNSLYKFVEQYSLFFSNQSGFRKTDSSVNKLLSRVHKIYKSFDNFPSLKT